MPKRPALGSWAAWVWVSVGGMEVRFGCFRGQWACVRVENLVICLGDEKSGEADIAGRNLLRRRKRARRSACTYSRTPQPIKQENGNSVPGEESTTCCEYNSNNPLQTPEPDLLSSFFNNVPFPFRRTQRWSQHLHWNQIPQIQFARKFIVPFRSSLFWGVWGGGSFPPPQPSDHKITSELEA